MPRSNVSEPAGCHQKKQAVLYPAGNPLEKKKEGDSVFRKRPAAYSKTDHCSFSIINFHEAHEIKKKTLYATIHRDILGKHEILREKTLLLNRLGLNTLYA